MSTEADEPPADPDAPAPPRRRRRWPRVVLGSFAGLLVLLLAAMGAPPSRQAGGGWLYWRTDQALDSIQRIPDALPSLPEHEQPPRAEGDALVFLLVGLDGGRR